MDNSASQCVQKNRNGTGFAIPSVAWRRNYIAKGSKLPMLTPCLARHEWDVVLVETTFSQDGDRLSGPDHLAHTDSGRLPACQTKRRGPRLGPLRTDGAVHAGCVAATNGEFPFGVARRARLVRRKPDCWA